MQASARRSSPGSCDASAWRGLTRSSLQFLTHFPGARDPLRKKRARTWPRGGSTAGQCRPRM